MKIFLDMIGCRLNQAEIEQMSFQLKAEGHQMVSTADDAEIVVINTCTVTAKAASDSRQKIRQAAKAGSEKIIVTGCWSTMQSQLASELPSVIRVIPNNRKDTLAKDPIFHDPDNYTQAISPGELFSSQNNNFDLELIKRTPLPGLRQRTRAFIKVQDGCDNACTFCITTIARGDSKSRPVEDVISNIESALRGGTREIILTGVHLGSWGQEFGQNLRFLITQILSHTDPPRLRLSSLEPWDLDDGFFSLWEDKRLCAHLHLPLQSGSNSTLRRMMRKTNTLSFQSLINSARKFIPDVAITTDIIAGFPGESESEFSESLEFVKAMNFAGGHVFTYSARPGTPAARIREQVPHEIRKQRNFQLRSAINESSKEYRERFIGHSFQVLWEASAERDEQGWKIKGLTGNYIRVSVIAPETRWNSLDIVKLTGLTELGMTGQLILS